MKYKPRMIKQIELYLCFLYLIKQTPFEVRGRCARDRMVVGFTITYAVNALRLSVRIPFMARCTRYNIMLTCERSMVFSGTAVSSTNKTDRHDITVAFNTINQAKPIIASIWCVPHILFLGYLFLILPMVGGSVRVLWLLPPLNLVVMI